MAVVFDRRVTEMEVPIADGNNILIQDLYNQIRIFEALSQNMDLRRIANGTGKQSLGGINQVGITLELINEWMVGFEARLGPAFIGCVIRGGNLTGDHTNDGLATSIGTTTLTDTSARFARQAFQTGETIRNITDGSTATIVTVDSETVLTHTPLTGGANNDWEIGDVWEVDSTTPVFGTAFTHVTISQDAAAVALDLSALIGVVPDEAHMAVAYVEGTTTLLLGVWLDRDGSTVLVPTTTTVTWYNPDGTQLFQVVDAGSDAQGHFAISLNQTLSDDTAYYADVAVTDATGTVTTRRGVPTAGT